MYKHLVRDPLSLPLGEAYLGAIDELMDVSGLSGIRPILKKYNLRHMTLDFKLQLTVRTYGPSSKDKGRKAKEEIEDIRGLSKVQSILTKYNLTYMQVTDDLEITTKRMRKFCPLKNACVV